MSPTVFRNYRFVIGAIAAIMLILILRNSSDHTIVIQKKPITADDVTTKAGQVGGSNGLSSNIELVDGSNAPSKSEGSPKIELAAASCGKDHQYVVIIDAGSSGSRVHVYEFDICTSPPTLIGETFQMLKPGLSSFKEDAVGAAASLDPLLEVAMKAIPKGMRHCSPIAVKATAGLRMLGDEMSNAILEEVRSHLEQNYPFPIVEDKDAIAIMGGDEEGVFAWVTTNYLLGNIGGTDRLPTAAVFDLGGGSTQIVFEPTFPRAEEKMVDGEHKYELEFGNEKYTLYQYSHLGYGLMQGRNKINSLLIETSLKNNLVTETQLKSGKAELVSPCLPPGGIYSDTVVMDKTTEYSVTFKGPSTPAGPQCRFLADQILNKDAACTEKPCSFNGVHQPSLVKTFQQQNDLYIFSFFYDRTQPLGMPLNFSLQELKDLATTVCNGEDVWESVLSGVEDGASTLKKSPEFCMDLSFQVSLLHTGYDIPLHRELKTASTIDGNEIGWCLGSALSVLDGNNWKCKVTQLD